MKISVGILLIAVVMAFDIEAQSVIEPADFASARAQAKADKEKDNDSQGCYMVCEFDPFFDEHFHPIMGTCFKQLESPEASTFTTVLRLSAEGRVRSTWLDLDSNLSRCALTAIKSIQFPSPPFAPYHARITVNIK